MGRALLVLLVWIWLAAPTATAGERLEPGKVHELQAAHGRSWSLFVPSKYSRKDSWPVVISSHGAGGSGKGEIGSWQGLANQHGFIVACPDMVTATNNRPKTSSLAADAEDDEVVLSIFAIMCEHFRVNRRAVMITGFSGGGNPSYHSGLRHPDVFTHICTRGGNFAPQQIPRSDEVLEAGRKKLQIFIFYGEHDHPLIVGAGGQPGQAKLAYDALEQAGYANVTIEEVPGMKHESRPRKAAEWFGAYLEANARRFQYGDEVDGLLEKAESALEKGKTQDAIKHLLKAKAVEEKRGLEPFTGPLLDRLEAEGRSRLDAATALKASDPAAARKALDTILKDYKGLPVGADAKALVADGKD